MKHGQEKYPALVAKELSDHILPNFLFFKQISHLRTESGSGFPKGPKAGCVAGNRSDSSFAFLLRCKYLLQLSLSEVP